MLVRAERSRSGACAARTTRPRRCKADADALKFPIRLPKLPDGWQANSGGRGSIDGGRTDAVGQAGARRDVEGGLPRADGDVRQPDPEQRRRGRSWSRRSTPAWCRRVRRTSTACGGSSTKVATASERADPVWTTRLTGPARPGADRDNRRRRYRRVPYAGGGDADAAAACPSARSDAGPSMARTAPEADLTGWTVAPFTAAGYTHDVYRKGEGPGVVLIPEMPGIHPGVLALGNHLVDNGFTVACPSLFGTPGAPGVRPGAVPVMVRGCVAKEFAGFATNADRPVAHYLRALARDLNEKTPGKGVGVIGQCFTGGFALGGRCRRQRAGAGAEPAVGCRSG